MSRMRINNDTTVLSEYLYCEIKSSKPRVHHRVCEERCRRVKKCPYYKEWYAQNHDEEIKPEPKRKKVVRRVKKKAKKKKLKVKVVSASCSS